MTQTSTAFAGFALAVLLLAAAVGPRRRWLVLLVASLAYYATWSSYLPLVLGGVALASYLGGLVLAREGGPGWHRPAALWGGISLAVGALLVLKYTGFAAATAASLAGGSTTAPPNPFVSIGVSYWALQVISYLLDVAGGVVPAERHPGRYLLYLSFFPKMLQGPIERPGKLLPQLADPAPLTWADAAASLRLVLWGLFQKLVVADRLAPFVEAAYGDPSRHPGLATFVATYLFAAQLYFDFAGYTCVALGVARAYGVRLSPNFASPYLAESVADFWRRWHMTFSSWILDYVFKPTQLGLRRWRTLGTPAALLLAFTFSGLWHGPSWSFVAWGLMHGIFLATPVLVASLRRRRRGGASRPQLALPVALRVLLTFHLVCLAWVPFRAASLRDAGQLLEHALTGLPRSVAALARGGAGEVLFLGQGGARFGLALALVAVAIAAPRLLPELAPAAVAPATAPPRPWPSWLGRAIVYAAMAYLVAFPGAAPQAFIYAQF